MFEVCKACGQTFTVIEPFDKGRFYYQHALECRVLKYKIKLHPYKPELAEDYESIVSN